LGKRCYRCPAQQTLLLLLLLLLLVTDDSAAAAGHTVKLSRFAWNPLLLLLLSQGLSVKGPEAADSVPAQHTR
jgi:hypothetical protein